MELIFENCREYNGDDSEYSELADETKKLFHSLVKVHLEGKVPDEDKVETKGKKGRSRESRSPSACKTPELTSESSSEEDSDDGRFVVCTRLTGAMYDFTTRSVCFG